MCMESWKGMGILDMDMGMGLENIEAKIVGILWTDDNLQSKKLAPLRRGRHLDWFYFILILLTTIAYN